MTSTNYHPWVSNQSTVNRSTHLILKSTLVVIITPILQMKKLSLRDMDLPKIMLLRTDRAGFKPKQSSPTITHHYPPCSSTLLIINREVYIIIFLNEFWNVVERKSIQSYSNNLYIFSIIRDVLNNTYRLLLYSLGQTTVSKAKVCAAGDSQEIVLGCFVIAVRSGFCLRLCSGSLGYSE